MKKTKWFAALAAIGLALFFAGCSGSVNTPNSPLTVENGVVVSCDKTAAGEITIPNTVTSIGDYAFSGCGKITSVIIPDSVYSVGEYAFSGCTGLTSVIIPNSVTYIGSGMFRGCSALSTVTIPARVTYIENDVFNACYSLSTIYYGGTKSRWKEMNVGIDSAVSVECIDGNVNDGSSENPDDPGDDEDLIEDGLYGFLTVQNGVVVSCERFAEGTVEIPEGVKTIGEYAFKSCSKMEAVVIPNSVTSIERCAFEDCRRLTSVTIPSDVTSIGEHAFCGCTKLTSITIPESVTSIGMNEFDDCPSLKTIQYGGTKEQWKAMNVGGVPDGVSVICSDGNFSGIENGQYGFLTVENGVVISCDKAATGTVEIPEGVKSIGNEAFKDCVGLTAVTIPDSVTSIGSDAFRSCGGLTSVEIPCSVTSIGSNAFYLCENLSAVTYGGTLSQWVSISNTAFYNVGLVVGGKAVSEITEITAGDLSGITSVGSYAFSGFENLTSVEIPYGVTSIGWHAFSSCNRLNSITIPESVTNIESGAFDGCFSLATVYFDGKKSQWNALNVSLSDSTTVICLKGESGTFGFLTVENGVVTKCDTSATGFIDIPDGVTSIGDGAFQNCTEIKGVVIPDGVTKIGSSAFKYCTSMLSLEIPSSVETVGYGAFEYTQSLQNVMCVGTVAQVAAMRLDTNGVDTGKVEVKCNYRNTNEGVCHYVASSADTTLEGYVVIPKNVTEIGYNAFKDCNALMGVGIPPSVTSIGNYAFQGCSGLTSVEIPSSVTSIGNFAFYGCSGLTSVEIPGSVTSIGESAFYDCNRLTSVDISVNITKIGRNPFSSNTKINYLGTIAQFVSGISSRLIIYSGNSYNPYISYNLTIDGRNVDEITEITAEDLQGVTRIESFAFFEWDNLQSVTIPDSVTYIGSNAFSGCSNLTSVDIPVNVTGTGYEPFSGNTKINYLGTIAQFVSGISSNLVIEGDERGEDGNYIRYSYNLTIDGRNVDEITEITEEDLQGVTKIAGFAFFEWDNLQSVTIPDSVTSIGYSAFRNCTELTSVTIPYSVTSIIGSTFFNCSKLTKVFYDGTETDWRNIDIPNNIFYSSLWVREITGSDGSTWTDM